MRRSVFSFALWGIALAGCHSAAREEPAKPDLLAADIDSTISPATDFFLYANGGWIKKTPVPAAESQWGVYNLVQEENYERLKQISEEAAARAGRKGSPGQQIGDFWFSGMDSAVIENQKITPLAPQLQQMADMKTARDLTIETATLHNLGMDVAFADYVSQDAKRSDVMAIYLTQGGLGMRSRDYYFKTDSASVRVRTAYREYIYRCLRTANPDSVQSRAAAENIYLLESRLAQSSRSREALRDNYRNYNKTSLAGLQKMCAAIDWVSYFKLAGMGKPDSVIVGQPEFFKTLNSELSRTPTGTWKWYFSFHLLHDNADQLDSVSRKNAFVYEQTLSGATEQRVRWKRVLDAEEEIVGESLGRLFVQKYFSAEEKARYVKMVENVREAFKERIQHLPWMSDSTKKKAFEKLAKINVKVGYPDKWKDFQTMLIDRGPWVLNMQRGRAWWRAREVHKLGKPVDKTEWGMTPQTYNAYYDPQNNEAVFPAASFFVPGLKTGELDDAFVYGYTAASTIGHELTHGFDDEGRQYDALGNLKGWWHPSDSVAFAIRAEKIIRQFDAFNPVDTMHINGSATEGENIADLGGILIGLDAFKKTAAYQRNKKIGGFTPVQRFFLGYAYSWLSNEKKAQLASQVMTDVHSPAKERVNGPLANIPDFYTAFDIKPGSPMYRADSLRVSIW